MINIYEPEIHETIYKIACCHSALKFVLIWFLSYFARKCGTTRQREDYRKGEGDSRGRIRPVRISTYYTAYLKKVVDLQGDVQEYNNPNFKSRMTAMGNLNAVIKIFIAICSNKCLKLLRITF